MKVTVSKKLTGALLGVCCYGAVQAQPCVETNLGTKTLYVAPFQQATKLPVGYEPVFINHVGRHGARHLTKPVASYYAYRLLMQADSASSLTNEGKRLQKMLQQLDGLEQKNVKSISVEGVLEQQGIASRMYRQNEAAFKQQQKGEWEATVTKEIRTKQTATAFINELQRLSGTQDSVVYSVNDTMLRFYDLSPAYTRFEDSGAWQKDLQQLKSKTGFAQLVTEVSSRLFNQPFLAQLSSAQKEEFITDVYGFYTILPSLKWEAEKAALRLNKDSLKQFFSCAALVGLSKTDQAEDYLLKGPGTNNKGIQTAIAATLLADFIQTTDDYVQSGKVPVRLRFSRAETIVPFATLLALQGASKAITDGSGFNSTVWDAAAVAPLSANIQWIVYKPVTGTHYLVKCPLNERAVRIVGLPAKGFPYYSWESVRKFYMARLEQLQLHLSDNLFNYLQQLK